MEVLEHLLAVLGRVLLWVCSALVVEELTLGGLARLLLTRPLRGRRGRDTGDAAAKGPAKRCREAESKAAQGEVSCSQSNTY
jgi:hypothetical protein